MAGAVENDMVIIDVAGQRAGLCLRAELLDRGLSSATIDRRIGAGALKPVRRGVYVVDELTNSLTPLHRAVAALSPVAIGFSSAGWVRGFPVQPPGPLTPVDVIVANSTNRRIHGVVLHRLRRPPTGIDVTTVHGLPVTSAARTLVDLAAVLGPARLRHLVQTQTAAADPTVDELVACFESVARQGVRGTVRMRGLLRSMFGEKPVQRSILEQAMHDLLQRHGFGSFVGQYRPPWYDGRRGVVDFAQPELRLVLEVDGRRWHRRDQEMTNDRRRDRLAARHGWLTLRFTWEEVTARPAALAAEIRAVIATRASAA